MGWDVNVRVTLHGFIEADGTSVRHFRMGTDLVYDQWYGMVQRASETQRSRKIVLFPLGHAKAKALGKQKATAN